MRKKTSFVVLFFLLSIVKGMWGSEPGPQEDIIWLTLKEVRAYAVEQSTATQNARLDIQKAKKKIWETTTIGLPHLDGKLTYQNMLKIPTTLIPAEFFDPDAEPGTFSEVKFGTQHNATAEATLSQLVFSGSYIVALQASKVYLKLSENNLSKSEIDVKENVTKTYYLTLMAEDTLKTLTTSLENLRKIHAETTELYKAGFIEDTDVDQIQLSVTDLENAEASMSRQVDITYRLLKFQMGFDLDKNIRLKDSLDQALETIYRENPLNSTFDLQTHIDYRLLSAQERAQSLLLKRQKSEYLPTISLYLTHQENAMRDRFNIFSAKGKWFPTTVAGINIQIPIFSFGQRAAQISQEKLELQKIHNSQEELSKGLRLELTQSKSQFTDSLEKTKKSRDNIALAKKIYDKTQVKYKEGISSSLDLIQVHNQYLTAVSNYTQAAVELLNAKTRLDKILSQL